MNELTMNIQKYPVLFSRITNGWEGLYTEKERTYRLLFDGYVVKIRFGGNVITVNKVVDNIETVEFIELPDEKHKDIRSMEMITEQKDNFLKVDEIRRFYKKSKEDNNFYVTDLYFDTKCGTNTEFELKNSFEAHSRESMVGDIKISTTKVSYNRNDISGMYKKVEGPTRVEKIFDLYRGNANINIAREMMLLNNGLLDEKCFDYISINGVKTSEEEYFNNLVSNMKK